MPDTQPITQSFPWLAIKYRRVYNNLNIIPVLISDDSLWVLTDDDPDPQIDGSLDYRILVPDRGINSGDLYRLI